MRTYSLILLAVLILATTGCRHDEFADQQQQLVIDGRIENGRHPVVQVTTTVPIVKEYQSVDSLQNNIVRWARVTVSDGEREEILVGKYDEQFYPPYVYVANNMRGEVGKSYRLQVDYNGMHAEAVTSIPSPVELDAIQWKKSDMADTLYTITARINDNPAQHNYYRLFTRIQHPNERRTFLPAYLGVFDDEMLAAQNEIVVNKGRTNLKKDYTPYFALGDTVIINFTQIGEDAYRYWRDYEEMLTLSRNPLFPVKKNLNGNVTGALGCWFGYGATQYQVVIEEK